MLYREKQKHFLLKRKIPEDWESAYVGGEECEIFRNEDGSAYVLVDVVPDSSSVVITQGS